MIAARPTIPPPRFWTLVALAALPPATRVYCAHEYTLANLAFAAAVEPDNDELAEAVKTFYASGEVKKIEKTQKSGCVIL